MRSLFDPEASVAVRERLIAEIDPAAWDRFVIASGGSFLGAWNVIRAERLLHTVRVFDLVAGGRVPVKIGQCAVAIDHDRVRFLDRLHLLPSHVDRWPQAVRQIADRCGAGRYTYGSPWNAERRCLTALRQAIPGARIADAATGMRAAEAASAKQVAGKGDLIDVVTAIGAAETALDTVVAVRDRVVNAYSEIMRMQI